MVSEFAGNRKKRERDDSKEKKRNQREGGSPYGAHEFPLESKSLRIWNFGPFFNLISL